MSAIENFVTVAITAETKFPTQVGFGTLLIAAFLGTVPIFNDRVREYSSLGDMVSDGFSSVPGTVTWPAYLAASKAFSQSPRPPSIKIGARRSGATQVLVFKPTSFVQGTVYRFSLIGGTASTDVAYVVPGSSSIAAVCTALQTAISAIAGLPGTAAVTGTNTTVTFTASAPGRMIQIKNINPELQLSDTTTDPGLAADLDAIALADGDFFGVGLDSNSKAEILAGAAWVQAQTAKVLAYHTADWATTDGTSTTDVVYSLKNSNYTKTFGQVTLDDSMSYAGIAWMSEEFPFVPGTSAYGLKTLNGVQSGSLSTTQESAVIAKNGNVYSTTAGLTLTRKGKVASGEWIDNIIGIDWLCARLKERMLGAMANTRKLPLTNKGISVVVTEIKAVLIIAQGTPSVPGLLSQDVEPTVLAPKAEDISPADKAARQLNGVTFSAEFANAINFVGIRGTISP